MKKIEKPYYEINGNLFCTAEIFINDVIVDEFKGEETQGKERLSGLVPINHVLLQSGKYNVTGKMYPRFKEKSLTSENSYLGIDFYCAEIENLKSTRYSFHPSIESPWDGLSENINYPYFEIATEIEVELPFVLDGWQNSVDLSKQDKNILFKGVLAYYRQIHALLKEHNAVKFLEISQEKMKLQETAFYFDEERKKSFREGALALFNQNLEVEPLIESELKLEIMGYGKLVRLMKLDGSQPLQFKSPNIKEQSNVELEVKLHMRNVDKGFSII
ncbi:hypothetical protein B0A58_02415 [Flavobacterium branchiophilum NBRC 15030 = ATCC 35035]|uniref:Uncharacterized protein n=1 Tax=Flavobacterium branchiophilum TaxID=55197 RepID=A0A543G251_9FLAO|nr:hypothetical protein [Flavobacterium branchiophilum]OXA80470.1 hypothetical protein B0A58_02415 [Flavobacterium branchiophilum NBRC 15030 = ATCC 35035]TQM40173.1 hypothetical protein BC670_1045 [Flavobacterium branchiophilum]GEM56116.1 hypothetical protein FB1_23370 [Flavobacterium branchiophilum NBRC 15030 = ATCC 35035]